MKNSNLLVFFVFMFGIPSFAANWYVSKTATGTGAGTSWTNAWTDFSSINYSSVACGDTIWIAGNSTYTTTLNINKTCTSGNPLTLKGVLATDTTPVASPGWSSAFDVSVNQIKATNAQVIFCCAYIVFDGRVGDAQSQVPYGMQFSYTTDGWTPAMGPNTSTGSNNVTVTHIEDIGPTCTDTGTVCANSNWGFNICCTVTSNYTLDHVWVHQWPEAVRPYNTTNLLVAYSYIGGDERVTTADHEDIIYASDPINGMVLHDNVLYDSGNDGVFLDNGGVVNFTAYNNLWVHNAGWHLELGKTGTCGPYKLYNNAFVSTDISNEYPYAWIGTGGCTPASGTDIQNNYFYNTQSDSSSSGVGIQGNETYQTGTSANGVSFSTSCTGCTSYALSSPINSAAYWVNKLATPLVASDYHLTTAGQTQFGGKGNNLTSTVCTTIPGVCTDKDGTTRPTTGAWTLGPYQTAAATPTTVNISGTVTATNVLRPGINLGGAGSGYGQLQMLKRLNQMNFGYLPPPIFRLIYPCYSGGTTNTPTSWYSALFSSTGFPANFWNGASYTYEPFQTYGLTNGTVTASTSNISTTTGITLTLGTGLPAACTPGTNTTNTDYLVVRQDYSNIPVNTVTPADYGLLTSASFVADTSPASTNTYQSLSVANGQTQNFFIDAVFGTWAPDPALGSVTWLNMNGSYNLTYKAKCTGSAGAVTYTANRIGGTTFISGTDTLPSCSATSGVGWQTYNHTFTASETGSQAATIQLSYAVSSTGGNVLLQDMDIIEGSTLAGNTTPFRDAVVRALQKINPGSLRLMTPASWSSSVPCQTSAIGMQCASGLKGFTIASVLNSIGYDDFLQLAYLLKAEPYITTGSFQTPADIAALVTWESTSGWTAKFKALGLHEWTADVNEPWNSGATGNQDGGNGYGYGLIMGAHVPPFRAATGYDSAVNRFVGANHFAGSQSYFNGGGTWVFNVLGQAGCTTTGGSTCPDAMEIAPYTLNTIDNITDLQTDETAEYSNLFSATCPYTGGCTMGSAKATQAMLSTTLGIQSVEYEASYSPEGGTLAITQAQMNQASHSVSTALNIYRGMLLAERDTGSYGPRNEFAFVDQPYNGGLNSTQQTSWTCEAYMSAGPGQLSSFVDVARPYCIIMQVGNTAIGSNSDLMSCAQSGQPTINYAGGQGGSIPANSSVNLVDIFCRGDGAGHFTIFAFNMDTVSHALVFSGAGAPTGTITKTVFGASNTLTDTNIDSLSQNSPAAVVAVPTSSTFSGSTDTLPAGSFTAYTYTLGGAVTPTTIKGLTITGAKFQ